jgi:hypothetical protein
MRGRSGLLRSVFVYRSRVKELKGRLLSRGNYRISLRTSMLSPSWIIRRRYVVLLVSIYHHGQVDDTMEASRG